MMTPLRWIILYCLISLPSMAQNAFNLNGSVDVSGINLRSNQTTSTVLNQKYALTCNRIFTPYVAGDAALHFSHQVQDFGGNRTYQSDLQPMVQLSWNTPWFAFGTHGERLISESDKPETDLSRDNGSMNFRTKPDFLPMLNLGLDLNRLYTPNNLQLRNVYEGDLMGGLNWQYKTLSMSYNANEQQTRNINAATVENRNTQNFRWDQSSDMFDRKLRIHSDYALNYRSENFEKPDSVPVLEWVPTQKVYFTIDKSPEFSLADSVNGLLDGNKTAPTSPHIQIGPDNTDANIAMDFGAEKTIGAVFLYANQKVLSPGVWTVYVSNASFFSNEMQWEQTSQPIGTHFDAAYVRFEITFPNITSRFLKVVFKGTADTAKVEITELEALQREVGKTSNHQQNSTQIISLNSTYLFSEDYDASLDVGFQNEPFTSDEVKKKMTFISLCPAISAITGLSRA